MPSIQLGQFRVVATWKKILLSLLALSFLVSLGLWQMHRGDEKKRLLAQYHAQTRLPVKQWKIGPELPLPYQRVSLEGVYELPQLLLDNQFYQHQWGYHVWSALRLDSSASGPLVMIDRGWVKGDPALHVLPKIELPSGKQRVQGHVYFPPENRWIQQPGVTANGAEPIVIEKFSPQLLNTLLGHPVLPFLVRLDPSDNNGFQRDWQIISMPAQRHFAYAVQWFLLAMILAGILIRLSVVKIASNHDQVSDDVLTVRQKTGGNRFILSVLLLLFLLPVGLAVWYYHHPQLWAKHLRNQGVLVKDSMVIPALGSSKKWRLVYVSSNPCESSCMQALDTLARVRLALGHRLYGLEVWLLLVGDGPETSHPIAAKLKEFDIRVKTVPNLPGAIQASRVWIVDDQNHVILTYADESNPRAIFADLKQLSRLWRI